MGMRFGVISSRSETLPDHRQSPVWRSLGDVLREELDAAGGVTLDRMESSR